MAAETVVRLSVGRKGQRGDKPWPTKVKAHKEIFAHIEGWYNTRRRHSSLGYLSPAGYEATEVSVPRREVA